MSYDYSILLHCRRMSYADLCKISFPKLGLLRTILALRVFCPDTVPTDNWATHQAKMAPTAGQGHTAVACASE